MKHPFRNRRSKRMTIPAQASCLKQSFPESTIRYSRTHNGLTWEGRLRPTAMSPSYLVRILYVLRERPNVTVIDPPLENRNGERIPHMFGQKRLCLFRYTHDEWDSSMRIDRTIIPWTCLWLFYYEIWLATGEWRGGGEHPEMNDSEQKTEQDDK